MKNFFFGQILFYQLNSTIIEYVQLSELEIEILKTENINCIIWFVDSHQMPAELIFHYPLSMTKDKFFKLENSTGWGNGVKVNLKLHFASLYRKLICCWLCTPPSGRILSFPQLISLQQFLPITRPVCVLYLQVYIKWWDYVLRSFFLKDLPHLQFQGLPSFENHHHPFK